MRETDIICTIQRRNTGCTTCNIIDHFSQQVEKVRLYLIRKGEIKKLKSRIKIKQNQRLVLSTQFTEGLETTVETGELRGRDELTPEDHSQKTIQRRTESHLPNSAVFGSTAKWEKRTFCSSSNLWGLCLGSEHQGNVLGLVSTQAASLIHTAPSLKWLQYNPSTA